MKNNYDELHNEFEVYCSSLYVDMDFYEELYRASVDELLNKHEFNCNCGERTKKIITFILQQRIDNNELVGQELRILLAIADSQDEK